MADPVHHHVHEVVSSAGDSSGFFANLFESFVPRRQCMNYESDVIWLHATSDFFIALAYFSIPIALIYFVRRRRDLEFNWMFLMFAAFILACGTTHLFGVWAIWNPLYRLDGLVKAATAAISVATAVLLWPLIPKALAVPSPSQLSEVNKNLEREIQERQTTQEKLHRSKEELEVRVHERTAELANINEALHAEIRQKEVAQREREELLQREQEALAEARNANRVKDEFLATLSHELRTPLNAILGWSHILTRPGIDKETLQQGLGTIERSVRAQARMIEDLLDMSRIVAGKIRLDPQRLSPSDVIATAIEAVRPTADAKGVRLEGILDSTVGSITGDANRFQQIVWNLLTNAIKFTPKAGLVQVMLKRVDSHIELSVSDNGQGIKPEFSPFLFERFRQADSSTTRRFGGLGLGLSIVKHLVELHGGTVRAASPGEGKGSTFTVSLPISAGKNSGHSDAEKLPTSAPESPDFQFSMPSLEGVCVLVIDDEQDALDLLARVLRERKATVETFLSAEEGLSAFVISPPKVIVCDVGMPVMDGYMFIQRVRKSENADAACTPAIALTAFARPEDRLRAYAAGYQVHLAKPVDPAELVAAVASLAQTRATSTW